ANVGRGLALPPPLLGGPSRIPWDRYPIQVPTECVPWPATPRRAVVNGFGFAGAIGVVVLEQAPPATAPEPSRAGSGQVMVFTLSAKSRRALSGQITRYRDYLYEHPELDIAEVCHTAAVGRGHFPYRVAGAVHDRAELAALLERGAARLASGGPTAASLRKVAFMFAGSGPQHPGMGAVLYEQFPEFAERIDECDRLFAEHLRLSIKDIMFGMPGAVADQRMIHEIRYAQPALFCLEYALANRWMSWGVGPKAVIGHSLGEVVAATVAGLFSLPDGVRFTAARSRWMHEVTAPGGMTAVSAPAEEIAPLLTGFTDLGIA